VCLFKSYARLGRTTIYWLLGFKSKFSTSNKLLIYETILKAIWIYETQMWGTASTFNTEILKSFQTKAVLMIVDRDLQTSTVREEIRQYSSQYSTRLSAHPNDPAVNLVELADNRRLRRHLPNDLPTTLLVIIVVA
jgi:hypothetical protein